ncbi:unnamed protein product [Kuraishia capsulata CBS 1993]|uniref:Serine hydrolase domain-containing protein n=1 Tax=Kuraishia capsulata CBS 1993 TaxID=1382522 RepID=W6MQ97_9ASCO|nr:uncharacterized protein KUCA_T00004851001 [Kuraishia capsulata CBS 1993]CDK28866.1 unnamed protein product [Kuraishia capsulata CBS 1993]
MSAKVIKGTVLCLHGFAQTGPNFSVKASGIRKALKKIGYHTVFMNAPIELKPADLPFEVSDVSKFGGDTAEDAQFRGWWYTNDDFDIEPAFQSLRDVYAESGPFVGILGFSQGAGLATICLNEWQKIIPGAEPLKFGILYSGFRVKPEKYQHFYASPIEIPSLHLYGELDTLVSNDRSEEIVKLCKEGTATVIKHPGGHFVPNTKDLLKKEVAWVESVLNPEEPVDESAKTSKDEAAELNELAKEIDQLGVA